MSTRIFFLDNQILIDTIPTPFVAGSLIASISGETIEIGRVESSFVFTAIPWDEIAARDGSTFDTSDAALAYVTGQLSMRRPIGGIVSLTAGMDLGGHKALMFSADGSGSAIYADPTDPDYVFAGVSIQAGAGGAAIQAVTDGLVIEPSWAWAPLQPVYVGSAGVLTQTPPTVGFFHLIGRAPSAISLMVAPDPIVILA